MNSFSPIRASSQENTVLMREREEVVQQQTGVSSSVKAAVELREATVRFHGEVFESEDQRNWGDYSFKTYSTPQARPKPVAVAPGPEGAGVDRRMGSGRQAEPHRGTLRGLRPPGGDSRRRRTSPLDRAESLRYR